MGKNIIRKTIEKINNEISEFLQEEKNPKERINFKRKQLQFLNADVHKPKIPFKRCMLSLKRKKERRIKKISRKFEVGFNAQRHSR